MADGKVILLDIGGTFIKCSDGREIPIDSAGCRENIALSLHEAVYGAPDFSSEDIPSAGIRIAAAVPGPFDYSTGQFLMKHKFASVYGEYFADIIGLPRENCRFLHDVNAMLYGEMTQGNGRGYDRVALLTIGTGLGFSMSLDGKILCNELGSPAVSIFKSPCRDGILEDYASKRGVWKLYGSDSLSVKELARLAFCGDVCAQEAFWTMGRIIGEHTAPIMAEYGIECLLFGGQISRSWQLFAPAVSRCFACAGLDTRTSPISDFDNATFNGLKSIQI